MEADLGYSEVFVISKTDFVVMSFIHNPNLCIISIIILDFCCPYRLVLHFKTLDFTKISIVR